MDSSILMVLYIVIMACSMIYVIKKRKKIKGESGVKSYITPLTFFVISILAFFSALTGKGGIAVWLSVTALLLAGAYFTKYLPSTNEKSS